MFNKKSRKKLNHDNERMALLEKTRKQEEWVSIFSRCHAIILNIMQANTAGMSFIPLANLTDDLDKENFAEHDDSMRATISELKQDCHDLQEAYNQVFKKGIAFQKQQSQKESVTEMKIVSATAIGILISAHIEGDHEKFMSYANFIADAYEEAGENLKAKIIRKRIDGSYKNEPQVTLDKGEENV